MNRRRLFIVITRHLAVLIPISNVSCSVKLFSANKLDSIYIDYLLWSTISVEYAFMEVQYRENGSGLPMIEVAPTAVAIAYRSRGDIMRAARLAANMGGDTDTVASMACMIIGAHVGASQIDERAIEIVSSVNDHPFESIAKGLSSIKA